MPVSRRCSADLPITACAEGVGSSRASRKVAGRSLYSSDRPEIKDYDGVFSGSLGEADVRSLSDAVSARQGQQFSFFTHRIRKALGREEVEKEEGYGSRGRRAL